MSTALSHVSASIELTSDALTTELGNDILLSISII